MDKKDHCILVINPGSTSTKLAIFKGKQEIYKELLEHSPEDLEKYGPANNQFAFRRELIEAWLKTIPDSDRRFDAVAGRGAPLKPLEGGTYLISDGLLRDVLSSRYADHASNLGPLLADYFSRQYSVPAYITDPPTVDNFTDMARISGLPEIERKCRAHALNIRAVARAEAAKKSSSLDEMTYIVAHMGGGISVAAVDRGKIVDTNDALLGQGPFTPDRAGSLPIGGLIEICYSGDYEKAELITILSRKSGLYAYLGESDLRKVESMIDGGNQKAHLIFNAMCYQIAKEIGAMSAVLKGNIDGIILTGGLAHSRRLTARISDHVSYIAPIHVVPGEFEMNALAEGAVRVLTGEEQAKIYT